MLNFISRNLVKTAFDIQLLEGTLPIPLIRHRTLGYLLSLVIPYIFPAAGIVLLLFIAYGGFVLMTSQGNPENIQRGKGIITTAIAGFFIVFLAYWVTYMLGQIFGLEEITQIFTKPGT